MLLLGFSCGIPFALSGATLQAWLASEKIDITIIGLFALVGTPYALKFLWAPFLDRFSMPFLGHRRGWILTTQVLLFFAIIVLGRLDPLHNPQRVAMAAVALAFLSASQDIVVDAYQRELLRPDEFGAGYSLYAAGYRIATIVSGALAFILADHLPWHTVYLIMATTLLVGMGTVLFAPNPPGKAQLPRTTLDAVIQPFLEFFSRKGSIETLIFILIYKLDSQMTVALTTPFMMSLGFTKTDIGTVTKGFGMVASILGALASGTVMIKWGLLRGLWIFGVLQSVAALAYMVLAHVGHHYPTMVVAVTVENFLSGTALTAFSAFMMAVCQKRFAATQLALLTSFMALSRYLAWAPSGFLAKYLGWEWYYIVCALAGIPGLLLLTRFSRWEMPALQDD